MFYYTFSVINTMFVLCTALLYDSPARTRTLNLSTNLLKVSRGIRLISLLMMSTLVCGLFSQTVSFRYPLRKYSVGLRNFTTQRQTLLNNLKSINASIMTENENSVVRTLLFGRLDFNYSTNKEIIKANISFVLTTERFSCPLF